MKAQRKQVDKIHEARNLIREYIEESPYIPHFFKENIITVVLSYFDPIRECIGNYELLYRRTYAHKDELDEHGVPYNEKPKRTKD